MQQVPIDKILTTLSLLLTSPENYLQINSQSADISKFYNNGANNISGANYKQQDMGNLSSVIDNLIGNQLVISERIQQIEFDIQTLIMQLSTANAFGCFGQQVGVVSMKLPNWPNAFPVKCVSNQYGYNWLLVAHKNSNSKLFGQARIQSYENGVGEYYGEYFIGFKKLRAITDNELYELLIIELRENNDKQWYDHYEAVAFDESNNVKLLGQYQTNRLSVPSGLTKQANAVKEKLNLKSNTDITIYLRRATLDVVPQLKGI